MAKETADAFLASLKDHMEKCNLPKVAIGYEIIPGVPEDEIIRYSESYQPDLVVMGTKGKGTGMGAIMGSVTASVINRISFPLLAIPEKYTFVGSENVKNLLYVTEFDETTVRMEGLMEYFKKSYGRDQVTYSFISQKNLLDDLDDLVKNKGINILSLTAHRQNIVEKLFKPNITKKLFYHSNIPLLVFH